MMKSYLLLAVLLFSCSHCLAEYVRKRADQLKGGGRPMVPRVAGKGEEGIHTSIKTFGKKLNKLKRELKGKDKGHKEFYNMHDYYMADGDDDDDYYGYAEDYDGYYQYKKKKSSKKGKKKSDKKSDKKKKSKKGKGSYYYQEEVEVQEGCHVIVEPVEFYMEPPIETVYVPGLGNETDADDADDADDVDDVDDVDAADDADAVEDTGDAADANATDAGARRRLEEHTDEEAQEIGTRWIFQGPLMEFDKNDGLVPLDDFFVSGVCTRTWENHGDEGIPGAAYCALTFTIDTGASINAGGEVFDGWNSNMGVEGGTFEMIGVSGQVTVTPLNEYFNPLDMEEDFFEDSHTIRGRGTLVYHICPAEYWQDAMDNFDNLDSSDDEGTFPDPFGLEESRSS